MKKSFISKVILLAVLLILALTLNVQAATTPELVMIENSKGVAIENVFANGTPIVINARTDAQPGAEITWEGCVTPIIVSETATVFGGMHNDNTPVTTSITMNGGTLVNVVVGGLHYSNTTSGSIVMNGGTVETLGGGGVGAGAGNWNKCGCSYASGASATTNPCTTSNATITVNAGTITDTVYGGGISGITVTNNPTINIAGGDLSNVYVVAGGSNGHTSNATVNVTGGTIGYLQSVNRGTMDKATMTVNGGTVSNLFVGGENHSSVTGTIDEVKLTVGENATVGTLSYGYNGGTDIDPTTGNINAEDVKVSGNANVGNKDALANTVTTTYTVTIDGKAYTLEAGKTIKDIPGYNSLITKDGHDFAGFISNGSMFDPNTVINSNIEMKIAFAPKAAPAPSAPATVEQEKDDTPKTGIDNLSAYVTIIAMISLMGIIVIKK